MASWFVSWLRAGWSFFRPRATLNKPVLTAAPAITGTLEVDETLTVSNGTWNNSPVSYTYQWFVNSVYTGETSNEYVVQASDAGKNVYARVTATNADGSRTAQSNTVTIEGAAPTGTSWDSGATWDDGVLWDA